MSEQLWVERPPAYRVPTMTEIRLRPRNGLIAVGSFSGCGGSSLGLRMAGWHTALAIEFIPEAAKTYRANFPDTHVIERDIRKVRAETIRSLLRIEPGQLDLLEGSPPCASFSTAGAREKDWGKVKKYGRVDIVEQRTDDLFWEWMRLLAFLRPRAFIAENVPGMLAGNALTDYAWKITGELSRLGYRVDARVLNAANYGVPQERRRLIFVGLRQDVRVAWSWPAVSPYPSHTLRQALNSVSGDDPDHQTFLAESSMEGWESGRTWHRIREMRASGGGDEEGQLDSSCRRCGVALEDHDVIGRRGNGVIARALCADGEPADFVKSYAMFVMPDPDRPSPTITAVAATVGTSSGVTHPDECRKLTPAEVKAICGFPADFILTGSREQRYERMGRAVPPLLYHALGLRLAEVLS